MLLRTIWLLLLLPLLLAGCRNDDNGGGVVETFTYTFDTGPDGFAPDFADLPADADLEPYLLEAAVHQLPLGVPGFGYLLKGDNQSSDLFMYVKREITGLKPNTTYDVAFHIDLVTAIPQGISGVGGSPGESVYVKAGASTTEPIAAPDEQNWLRMNIDKGDQSQGGDDMIVLGDIAYEITDSSDDGSWTIKPLDNGDQQFTVTTDDDGAFWLLAGTDSAFAGLSAYFFDAISATLTE